MTSGVSSVSESEFITYLVPKICTSCSKYLHSCLSPLSTGKKGIIISSKKARWIRVVQYILRLLSSLQELSEVGPQPLHPGLTLFGGAEVALAGHDLRNLLIDAFVLVATLQILLDLSAPPNVQ